MEDSNSTLDTPVVSKVKSIALYDDLDGNVVNVTPVTHAKNGGATNPKIYKVTASSEVSLYGNVNGDKCFHIKGIKLLSTNPVDVAFHYEEYVDGSWHDLGLAFSADTDAYLEFKGSPAAGEPSSQDWNWIPLDIPVDATPFRLRLEPTGETTLKAQVVEE